MLVVRWVCLIVGGRVVVIVECGMMQAVEDSQLQRQQARPYEGNNCGLRRCYKGLQL